jgi:DNA-binding response OmpR family regulator
MVSIVIIEDDAAVREVLRVGLESAGYNVREAKNGRDGTREFRKAPTDLVITDIYMPDCDGLDVIRRLRRVHPKLKILAISGASGTMDFLKTARSLGASRVLYKPFVIADLLKTVAQLLAEDDAAAATKAHTS